MGTIAANDALKSASTPTAVEAVLNDVSNILANVAEVLGGQQAFPFEVALRPNSVVALPAQPTSFSVEIKNTGNRTATYNVALSDLPAEISGGLSKTTVTLAPGQFIPASQTGEIHVTLTQPEQALSAFEFSVTVTVSGAPGASRTATGAITARSEVVEVTGVEVDPSFTDPGGSANVSDPASPSVCKS